MKTTEGKFFYLRDSIGTIVGLVDEDEVLVNEYVYDAFGNIVYIDEDVAQPYKFTAREYDDETNQYYYRTRTYMPETGRFIQIDSLGMVDGTNLYTYVTNNPVNLIDPLGEKKCGKWDVVCKAKKAAKKIAKAAAAVACGALWIGVGASMSLLLTTYKTPAGQAIVFGLVTAWIGQLWTKACVASILGEKFSMTTSEWLGRTSVWAFGVWLCTPVSVFDPPGGILCGASYSLIMLIAKESLSLA